MQRRALGTAFWSLVIVSSGVAQEPCLDFAEFATYPVDTFAYELVHDDLNGDGHQDLLVGSQAPPKVEVFLGTGTGSFVAAPSIVSNGGSIGGLAVGELSGDGIPDLVLACDHPSPGFLHVALGVGDGSFGPATFYYTRPEPGDILLHDLDGNGTLDIATVNESSDSVSVLLGLGDGSFGVPQLHPVRNGPRALVAIELNGDAAPDLVINNFYSNRMSLLVGVGDGSFQSGGTVGDEAPPALAVGDVTGDGIDDLVTTKAYSGRLETYPGLGNGTLGPVLWSSSTAGMPYKVVALQDLDLDGLLDVALVQDSTIGVRLGFGDGDFGPLATFEGGFDQRAMAVGDWNGDGLPDFAVLSRQPNELRILLQSPTGIETYCSSSPNSVGPGAHITASGSLRVVDNDLELAVTGLPALQPGLFFCGDQQADLPFEGGTLCVGGTHGLYRILPPVQSSPAGTAGRTVDLVQAPFDLPGSAVLPGSSWAFQYWYRDPAAPPGARVNLSDAVLVQFCR